MKLSTDTCYMLNCLSLSLMIGLFIAFKVLGG